MPLIPEDRKKAHSIFFCLGLSFLVLAIYWQVLDHEFINFDDNVYISDNKEVKHGLNLDGLSWALTTSYASNWHPVTWLSHMLDHQLFGLNAGFHHLMSVLFHLINAILLFYFLNSTKTLY